MKKPGAETISEAGEERKGPIITITASESRRRCDRRFPKEVPVEVAASEFTEAEWKLIAADPMLHIQPSTD